jgi:hypothetical protein
MVRRDHRRCTQARDQATYESRSADSSRSAEEGQTLGPVGAAVHRHEQVHEIATKWVEDQSNRCEGERSRRQELEWPLVTAARGSWPYNAGSLNNHVSTPSCERQSEATQNGSAAGTWCCLPGRVASSKLSKSCRREDTGAKGQKLVETTPSKKTPPYRLYKISCTPKVMHVHTMHSYACSVNFTHE